MLLPGPPYGCFPINAGAGGIHDYQGWARVALQRKALLEGWQRAYCYGLDVVMTQGIADLHCEEEIFFQCQYRCCHGSLFLMQKHLIFSLLNARTRDGGS